MPDANRKERVAGLAARQQGRVSVGQLLALGLSRETVRSWKRGGYLIPVLPRVYAVGHLAPSYEADLWAAVLYAGPEAALSHRTAAAWRGLIKWPPTVIEVSTPRDVDSRPGVCVYRRPGLVRAMWRGLPVTGVAQTVVDLAAVSSPRLVRRTLAQLDVDKTLDVRALEDVCSRGRPGSRALRIALAAHQPLIARTNEGPEEEFLELCERFGLDPLPQINVWVHDELVDAYWPDAGLVVELDSEVNHSSPAQRRRDRARDLKLRGHGLMVFRYDLMLVRRQPRSVLDDVLRGLRQAGVDANRGERGRGRTGAGASGGG